MNEIIEKYCSQEWHEFIKLQSEIRTFKKNEVIFDFDEEVEGIFLINSGKVKIVKKTPSSLMRVIRLAADGDVLGHRGLGGEWKYSITAIALEDTEVVFIPINVFNQIVKTNPEFAFFIMMFFADELRDSESLANQCPVKQLISLALVKNHNAFGLEEGSTKLSYTMSRKDLASMAGTTYESTIRSLSELQKEGAIKLEGKAIHILSLKQLMSLSRS